MDFITNNIYYKIYQVNGAIITTDKTTTWNK